VPIPDPEAAAEIAVQRLIDAGFEIKAPRSGPDHVASAPIGKEAQPPAPGRAHARRLRR
jgi:hypothetical protein